MLYFIYILTGLVGGVLIGMAGLTAAMVVTPILAGICGWNAYDATTMSLIANVPAAIVASYTYYKNGNVDLRQSRSVSVSAFIGAVAGSWLGYLFSKVSEGGISYLVILGNLFMAYKFLRPVKVKEEKKNENSGGIRENKKLILAILLSFLIGAECGFMGSAGGMMMLMVLTLVLGMNTKQAVGTGSVVMTLVALTGAISHKMMGATVELLPAIVITVACTVGAICSSKFANKVDEKVMSRCAGLVLILVSVASILIN